MKFRCEREVLAEAFGAASRASTGRATNPTYSCLRLALGDESLRVTGTDGDLTIESTVAVAKGSDGVVLVPAKLVSEVVRSLPAGAVDFEVKGDSAVIESDRVRFTVPLAAEGDFPKWSGSVGVGAPMSAKDLSEALKQVVRAASTDELRGIYTGVMFTSVNGNLRLVSTDMYRLAVREVDASILADGTKVIIPARALSELQRLLSAGDRVSMAVTDNDVTFEVGNVRLVSRRLIGDFPAYENLIPSNLPITIVVNREEMMESVRRVKLVAKDPVGTPLRLQTSADSITLRMITPDNGESTAIVDAKVQGDDIAEIRFNNEMLLQGLDAITAEEVSIQISEPRKPALIRGVGQNDYTYLLMPLRV